MIVFVLTLQKYDTTDVLGVYGTRELAQEHIDWCMKRDSRLNEYSFDIIEETVIGGL
jgi:hypothetical protein